MRAPPTRWTERLEQGSPHKARRLPGKPSPVESDDADGDLDQAPSAAGEGLRLRGGHEADAVLDVSFVGHQFAESLLCTGSIRSLPQRPTKLLRGERMSPCPSPSNR